MKAFDKRPEAGSEEDTIELSLDDGSTLTCHIITVFTAGKRDYIALLPQAEDDAPILYRYSEHGDEFELDNIEDDEEFDIASDAFDEWLDDQEFDEYVAAEEKDFTPKG